MQTYSATSTSAQETISLGENLGRALRGGELIECRSDLGGGKTTLVAGIAKGFGSVDPVASPSFTLCNTYSVKNSKQLYHFDFYRLIEPGIMRAELAEVLDDPSAVTIIEWADIVEHILPKQHIVVSIQSSGDTTRNITITIPDTLDYISSSLRKVAK